MTPKILGQSESSSNFIRNLPPVIYLDTQDYVRFGDVLRGKSDGATENLFTTLEARKKSGDVIFAVSMPILGELLQYNANYRETTLRKAEAVERLCGGWALAYPSRLVAADIAATAKELNLLSDIPDICVLSSDRYWHPFVGHIFEDLKSKMDAIIINEAETLNIAPRKLKRIAANKIRKIDVRKIKSDVAPEISKKYGISVETVSRSIISFLKGKIDSGQASRIFFSEVLEPVKFVEIYFEKIESDRALPHWIGNSGKIIENGIIKFREHANNLSLTENQIKEQLEISKIIWGKTVLTLAQDAADEFCIQDELIDHFSADSALIEKVASCNIIGAATTSYIGQTMGLNGSISNIEPSFGGDLFHSLYLPHVDLWRSDVRFSSALRAVMPEYGKRIVPRLKDLPAAIDTLLAARKIS